MTFSISASGSLIMALTAAICSATWGLFSFKRINVASCLAAYGNSTSFTNEIRVMVPSISVKIAFIIIAVPQYLLFLTVPARN